MTIVRTEGVLGGEPRLDGRRVSVLQVAERIVTHGQEPERVADQLGISMGEVHHALAYYYDHPDEMNEVRGRHEELEAELEGVATPPPETAEQ